MYLIIGASGTLGRRVAHRLLARGEAVRALTRQAYRLADLAELGADVVEGDLLEEGWQRGALEGVSTVVISCHGLVPPSRRNHPESVDREGIGRIIDASRRAGVEHVLYISAAGASTESPILFYRVKGQTERHLRESGAHYTIIRPTVFTETHALRLMGEPLLGSGKVQIFGTGSPTLNWISAEDVADFVVRCAYESGLQGMTHTIGGPEDLSRLDALEILEQRVGRQARRSHVPVPVIRFMKTSVGAFHPGMRYLLDMTLGPELGTDRAPSPESLDWVGTTTVEQVVERWLLQGPG